MVNNYPYPVCDIRYFFNYYFYCQHNPLLKYNIVTYFNQFIQTIIKCLLYKEINKKYTIYKLNNVKYDHNLDYLKFILKYPNISKIINKINFSLI